MVETDTEHMLNLAQELEKKQEVKGVYFKYNSTTKKLFK